VTPCSCNFRHSGKIQAVVATDTIRWKVEWLDKVLGETGSVIGNTTKMMFNDAVTKQMRETNIAILASSTNG
jgi:hypothetical protein